MQQSAYRWKAPQLSSIEPILGPDEPVAIIAPHPDDAEIAVGALTRRLTDAGIPVHVLSVYPGYRFARPSKLSKDRNAAIRRAEAMAAAAWTGATLHWLDLADAYERPNYANSAQDVQRMAETMIRSSIRIVFVPPFFDQHPAHQAARELTALALEEIGASHVRIVTWDSPWNPLGGDTPPTHFFAYDRELAKAKARAIRSHQSQVVGTDYVRLSRSHDHAWAIRIPELVSGHKTTGIGSTGMMVGAEVFRLEELDPAHACGPSVDPVQMALGALRRARGGARRNGHRRPAFN